MATATAPASTLTLEELKQPDLSVDRVLVLVGAGLPFRGAGWKTEMKLKTKWYPGNAASATQHVLGPMEIPSDWEGFWRTTRLVVSPCLFTPSGGGESVQITSADTLRDIVDSMFYVGALLRVTWAQGNDRKVVRVGRAATWDFPHDRADDIGWKISFAWTGRGAVTQRVVAFRADSPQPGTDAALKALNQVVANLAIDAATGSAPATPGGSNSSFGLADLAALANGPGQLMQQFGQQVNAIANRIGVIGGLVTTVATMPASLAAQVEAAGSNMEAACLQFSDQISRIPPDSYATSGTSKVSQVGKLAVYIGRAQAAAASAAVAAFELAERARQRRSALAASTASRSKSGPADILGTIISKQGDTFASIALRFYGDVEKGAFIAEANGFSSYQIAPPAGTPVILPNKAAIADIRAS